MGTYVVGDIHGCFKEWMSMKNKIEREDPEAVFISVGDIIDRGKGMLDMLDWAYDNITDNGKYQMVLGNHEWEKMRWWENSFLKYPPSRLPHENYFYAAKFDEADKTTEDIKKSIDFFKTLPLYKDIEVNGKRYIIVHADLPWYIIDEETGKIDDKKINPRSIDGIVWERTCEPFTEIKDATLIHGHTPTVFAEAFPYEMEEKDIKKGKILHLEGRINIDCGCVYRQYYKDGDLAILRLDDMKEYYYYDDKQGE